MKTSLRFVVLLVAVFGLATVSSAAPITYTIAGIASGQLGATQFTNALVTVTAIADTDNVVSQSGDFDLDGDVESIYANPLGLTTVTIAGLGTVDLSDPAGIYSFPGFANVDPGEELLLLPAVVIGTLDAPPALDSFTGLAGSVGAPLLGYDLATSFGPFVGLGGVGHPTGLFVNTSAGPLSFTSNLAEDLNGTFTATVAVVPEPTSLSLLGYGILSFAGLSRFRKRG